MVAGPVPHAAGPIYWLAVGVALPDLMIDEVWRAGCAELLGPPTAQLGSVCGSASGVGALLPPGEGA